MSSNNNGFYNGSTNGESSTPASNGGAFGGCFSILNPCRYPTTNNNNQRIEINTGFLNGSISEAMSNAANQTPRYFGGRTKLLVGRSEFDDVRQRIENEMAALSIHERKRVHDDLYGATGSVVETEELLHESLARLENCLNEIPKKEAYDLARSMSEA